MSTSRTHPRAARPALSTALLALSFAASLLVSAGTQARADDFDKKSDRYLKHKEASAAAGDWASVILKLDGTLTPAVEGQLKAINATVYKRLPLVGSVALRIPVKQLRLLAKLPISKRLSEDVMVFKTDEFTTGRSGADMAFQTYALTGAGITVAVLDSGIAAHPDLVDPATGASRVLGGVSFVPFDPSTGDVTGHGTHVAGIVAGNGAASTGSAYSRTFRGIARKVGLVNVRVLDSAGQGDTSAVIEGIQWVINNKSQYNIRVMNISFGHPVGESYKTDPLCQAVEAAWQAGIVVVCAAGNDGRAQTTSSPSLTNSGYGETYCSVTSPANDPYVITVGAMKATDALRSNDQIASYSSRGFTMIDHVLKPDIVAPGNQVISLRVPGSTSDVNYSSNIVPLTDYCSNFSETSSSQYFRMSGTSMATPVVSGAVALMLQANPNLSPSTVKARLMTTATKWVDPLGAADATAFGAGYMDIMSALSSNIVAQQSAMSPILVKDSSGTVKVDTATLPGGAYNIWGTGVSGLNSVWGSAIVANSTVMSNSSTLVTQGDISSEPASQIIWGTGTYLNELSLIGSRGDR
jgi:serine protease AprX